MTPHPRSFVPFALALACCAFAGACGSSSPAVATHPPDGGDAGSQPPEPAPEAGASPDGAPEAPVGSPDAAIEATPLPPIDAIPSDARGELPTLADAAIAGNCNTPLGPKCPVTYLGTSVIRTASNNLAAALASDGALYLGGNFSDTVDFDPTAGMDVRMRQGYADAFLTRLGPTGAYGFTDAFPGSDFWGATITSVAPTTGAVVIAGTWNGDIDLDPGPGLDTHSVDLEGYGTFIEKVTSSGAYVWARAFTSTTTVGVSWGQVTSGADGTVYASGGFSPGADLDPGPAVHKAPNTNGVLFTRLDDKGNLSWFVTVGGDLCEWTGLGGLMTVAPDGTLWVADSYKGTCAFDQGGPSTAPGSEGLLIAAIGSDGKVRLLKTIAANMNLTGIATTPNGSIAIAGDVSSSTQGQNAVVDFDPSVAVVNRVVPADKGSAFVLELDKAGAFGAVQTFPGEMRIEAIGGAPDNGVVVVGGTLPVTDGMFILKLDANLLQSWRLKAGGRGSWPTGVAVDANGFVVTGRNNFTGDFDPSGGIDHFEGNLLFVSRYQF